MIKYFLFRVDNISEEIDQLHVLCDRPETYDNGIKYVDIDDGFLYHICYIDVEKYINYNGSLSLELQKIYDELILQERFKKLNTI